MAQRTVRALDATIRLFAVVDPTAIESQEIINKSGSPLRLTFVKDIVNGDGYEVTGPDDTVVIPEIKAGETYTITAQMITDALAAGNHSDIYEFSPVELGSTTAKLDQTVI